MSETADSSALERLFAVIEARRGVDAATSYTAKLLAAGTEKITEKVMEEALETKVAALQEGPDRLVSESADLLYHLLVLWADAGLKPDDIWAELAKREGISGLAEKASRGRTAS